jgi:hypothetical protein
MRSARAAALAAVIALSPVTSVRGQMRPQDMVKRGLRVAPLPPGEGGTVSLTAPADYCIDGSYFLLVRHHQTGPEGGFAFVVQTPAGPSECRWTIDGLKEGMYDALILFRSTGEIAATARGQVVRAQTNPMTIRPLQTEIEGVVTVDGVPSTEGIQLTFTHDTSPSWRWKPSMGANGQYRIKLDGESSERLCAEVTRARPLNIVRECLAVQPGLQHFNIDIAPGVIRVYVPPVPSAPDDRDALVVVNSFSRFFKLAEGFDGEYFSGGYKEYRISVTTLARELLSEEVRVTLSPEHPVADIGLSLAAALQGAQPRPRRKSPK